MRLCATLRVGRRRIDVARRVSRRGRGADGAGGWPSRAPESSSSSVTGTPNQPRFGELEATSAVAHVLVAPAVPLVRIELAVHLGVGPREVEVGPAGRARGRRDAAASARAARRRGGAAAAAVSGVLSVLRAGGTKLASSSSTTRPPGRRRPPSRSHSRQTRGQIHEVAAQGFLSARSSVARPQLAAFDEEREVADDAGRPGHRDAVRDT